MRALKTICNELDENRLCLEGEGYRIYTAPPRRVVFDAGRDSNGWHVHNLYEACVCLRGEGVFCTGQRSHLFAPGSVFMGVPGLPHEIHRTGREEMELFYFIFQPELTAEGAGSPEAQLVRGFVSAHQSVLHGCARLQAYAPLFALYPAQKVTPSFCHLMRALILECMAQLSGTQRELDAEQAVTDYILSHLGGRISVADLSRVLSVSERGVYAYFHQAFGVTPGEYLRRLRISVAKGYLSMGFSVAQAAEKAGFPDTSAFCRAFKRAEGATALDYRRRIRWQQP